MLIPKVKSFTKTWEDADKALRLDFLNHQTTKKNFFKKRLPEHLLSEANDLNRATYVYNFIRDHFTWNGINWISSEISVKESFDKIWKCCCCKSVFV